MRLDVNRYNIIDGNDNDLIGHVGDMIRLYKDYVKQLVDDMNSETSDELRVEVTQVLDLINGLYQDIITNRINYFTLIKVFYNPMGAYQYKMLKEVE